jgi:hypothetical protein
MSVRTACLLTCLMAAGFARAEEPASTENVTAWISDLQSESFDIREAAQKKLESSGEPALPALKEASVNAKDPEVRNRAAAAIEEITVGPRIQAAIKDLEGPDWNKALPAAQFLWDELWKNRGGREALERAGRGTSIGAQSAQALTGMKQEVDNQIRQQQEYIDNMSNGINDQQRQQMRSQLAQYPNNWRGQIQNRIAHLYRH